MLDLEEPGPSGKPRPSVLSRFHHGRRRRPQIILLGGVALDKDVALICLASMRRSDRGRYHQLLLQSCNTVQRGENDAAFRRAIEDIAELPRMTPHLAARFCSLVTAGSSS
jgi:hypothetical protein